MALGFSLFKKIMCLRKVKIFKIYIFLSQLIWQQSVCYREKAFQTVSHWSNQNQSWLGFYLSSSLGFTRIYRDYWNPQTMFNIYRDYYWSRQTMFDNCRDYWSLQTMFNIYRDHWGLQTMFDICRDYWSLQTMFNIYKDYWSLQTMFDICRDYWSLQTMFNICKDYWSLQTMFNICRDYLSLQTKCWCGWTLSWVTSTNHCIFDCYISSW